MLNDVYVLSFVGVEFIIRRLVVVVIVAAIAIVLGKYGRRQQTIDISCIIFIRNTLSTTVLMYLLSWCINVSTICMTASFTKYDKQASKMES